MPTARSKPRVCGTCKTSVGADFCPRCGTLFSDELKCKKHKTARAIGVCVICCVPYCSECATRVIKTILCREHEGYEIYEGMARVYGVSDEAAAKYISSCLEQKGLNPFVYSRKASPMSIGGTDYTSFRASGEFAGHIINELKVMVPCHEVIEAEHMIRVLETKTTKR